MSSRIQTRNLIGRELRVRFDDKRHKSLEDLPTRPRKRNHQSTSPTSKTETEIIDKRTGGCRARITTARTIGADSSLLKHAYKRLEPISDLNHRMGRRANRANRKIDQHKLTKVERTVRRRLSSSTNKRMGKIRKRNPIKTWCYRIYALIRNIRKNR